jgi:hypothetical protein
MARWNERGNASLEDSKMTMGGSQAAGWMDFHGGKKE